MNIFAVFNRLIRSLIKYPLIITPFMLMALVDIVLLVTLFYAPRPPISLIVSPVIRALWGEKYLHYPANFLLLPELFSYGKNALTFVTGLIFSGITITMLVQISNNKELDWRFGLAKALKKYSRMFFIWAAILMVSAVAIKALDSLEPVVHSLKYLFASQFLVSIITQTFFLYSIPSIIIENKKTINSITRSFMLVRQYPAISLAVILLPNLLLMPINYIHFETPYIMSALFPEAVLWTLVIRIVFTTAMDFIITTSAASVLLMHREAENKRVTV